MTRSGPDLSLGVGPQGPILAGLLRLAPAAMALLREVRPLLRLGHSAWSTRYDDVVEVFATDKVYGAPYAPIWTSSRAANPSFSGCDDGADYRAQIAAMRAVVRADDLRGLGDRAEELAVCGVAQSDGSLEVVQFIRGISFELMGDYFGVADPGDGMLGVLGIAPVRVPVHRLGARHGLARGGRGSRRAVPGTYRQHDRGTQERRLALARARRCA